MTATSIRVRLDERNAEHDRMTVFAGPEGGTRANCGTLTMRRDEATAFRSALVFGQGADVGPLGGVVVEVDGAAEMSG